MAASDAFYKGSLVGNQTRKNRQEDEKTNAAKEETKSQEQMQRRAELEEAKSGYYSTDSAPNESLTQEPMRKSEGGKYGDSMSEFERITGRKSAF